MFRGIHAINVDEKGRMAVPSCYRQPLNEDSKGKLVITIDTEQHCLLLYPLSIWEALEAKIAALPSFHPVTRRIQRLLIGHASEVEMDKNGRILVSPLLREYAGISKRVVVLGQGNKFEIWDEENWQKSRDGWLTEHLDEAELPEELKEISL